MPTWGHGAQLRPTALTTACVFHPQYLALPCSHPASSYRLLFPGLECPSSPLHSRPETPPTSYPGSPLSRAGSTLLAPLPLLLCGLGLFCGSLSLIFLFSKMKHRTKLSSPRCGVVRAKLLTWRWVKCEPPPPWPSLPQLCTQLFAPSSAPHAPTPPSGGRGQSHPPRASYSATVAWLQG